MDNLEGFPEKTCTVESYKRWILFPLIFKSVPAATMHQPVVRAQQELGASQKAGVTPVQQCHHWWGTVPQALSMAGWAGSCWQVLLILPWKMEQWGSILEKKQQHGSKGHPGDRAKDTTGYKLHYMYEGSFQKKSFLQPRSIQEMKAEAGLQAGIPAAKLRKKAGG